MQADVSIKLRGTDNGPVLDRHPVITSRYGVLRRLLVLWTLTQAVADATGLRPSENTVMASLTSVNADSHSASTYSFARKRSYKRAVRRAAQSEGQHTQYRGRVCTLQQLCRGYRGRQPQQGPSRRSHQPFLQRAQNRLLVLTWNAGGLTQALWQELLLTLEHMNLHERPQIVCVQETHWTTAVATTFQTGDWEIYTSPTTDNKSAGLLTLIDKRLTTQCRIVYADPIPGRLQHIRLLQGGWTADVINVYQKPHNSCPKATKQAKEIRLEVWEALRKLLHILPARNTVVLLGDCNCPIKSCAATGVRISPSRYSGNAPPDQFRLQQLMEDFSLVHLNSWCRGAGATFFHHQGVSLIDHILMRGTQLDDRAKQAKPVKLGLAAWRLGNYHLPVKACIPLVRFHTLNRVPPPRRQWDHWGLIQACANPLDPRVLHLRALVQSSVGSAQDLQQMHDLLMQHAAQAFPPPVGQHRLALWQTPPMRDGIKAMWRTYHEWKRAKQQCPGNPLHTSRCFHLFKTAQKAFRQAGKTAKRSWFRARLQDLQSSAASRDSRALYAGVRSLAPKSQRIKVQLRDGDGQIQDPEVQLQQLTRHYKKLYAADADPEIVGPDRRPICLDIPVDAMTQALAGLSPHKATPPELATNSLWKVTADIVAPTLVQWTRKWTRIPALWKNAWLALIPKIPRPISPKNLRPIGLTESSGRAYASLLQAQLRPIAEAFLCGGAQFAYLPGRNAAQAIHRVAGHCHFVQQQCSYATPTVVDRHAQLPRRNPHFAGIQLSLDLSSAFDLLDWRLLDKALQSARTPPELRNQIMSWHFEIYYVVSHMGHTARICAQKGLRQGCKLAPLLWTMALEQIHRELLAEEDPLITATWLQHSSTTYADDIHLREIMWTVQDLDNMVYRFCKVLDALQAHGMVINSGKSAFLLRYRGSFIKAWLRRHLVHKDHGDSLRIRSPGGTVYEIPLKDQHTYLGIRISYHSQSKHAAAHRLQAAQHAWQRLKGILCSTRHLAQWHRLQLWKTIILPTLLYGIAASNPTDKDIKRLQNMATRQLRAITKSFAHMQHESTQNLLRRCCMPTIVEALSREAQALHSSLLSLQPHASFTTAAQVEDARILAAQLHLKVQQQWRMPVDGDLADATAYQCEDCNRTFTSFRLLRAHEAKWHGKKTTKLPPSAFDRNTHGLNGLPTCRHCRHPFRQWDGLVKHIQRNRCQVLRDRASQVSDSTACVRVDPVPSLDTRPTDDAASPPRAGPPSSVAPCDNASMADDSVTNLVPEAPCSTSTQVEPLPRPTAETSADLPLMQWPSVQEHLHHGRWTQLLHDAHVREYLQHRCPVCYQWLATTTSIKYHLTVQHPEWSTAQPAALKLLQGFRRHMVVPCRYCLQRNINKDRHWKQCHVLHICAFLAVQHGRDGERSYGPRCSGAPVLDAGGTTEAGTRGGQVLSADRERDDQKAEAGHAKQGQRKGQKQQGQEQRLPKDRPTKPDSGSIERCVERGLHRWFRRADDRSLASHSGQPPSNGVRSRMDDSSREHLGAVGSEARADSCLPSPGLGDLPLCSLRKGGNGAGALRGCRQMASNEGGGAGQIDLLLETCHVQAAADLTAPTTERDDQGQSSHGSGGVSQLGRRETTLATSTLEPSSAAFGGRSQSSSDPHRGSVDATGSGSQGGDRRITASFQVCEEVVEGGHGGLDPVSDLRVIETRGRSHLEHSQSMDRSSILAHAGLSDETRTSELRQPHAASVEPDVDEVPRLKALLRLVLHNPTNLCYLHSTIYAVYWTMLQARLHHAGMPSLPQVFTKLCPKDLSSSRSSTDRVQVLRLLPWSIVLRAWRNAHRQHDVAEFAMYLLPRISPVGMSGCWEARNYTDAGVVTLDSGSLETPIPLHPNAGATIHLQQSLEGWSSQARARYALCHAPQILCLQLMRNCQQGESVRKDARPLEGLSGVLQLPMYQGAHTLSTALQPYQVAAVQHHYGETPVTGHYRSLLCGRKFFAEGRCWLTDDGKPAQSTQLESSALSTTAYLIWLCQAPET